MNGYITIGEWLKSEKRVRVRGLKAGNRQAQGRRLVHIHVIFTPVSRH